MDRQAGLRAVRHPRACRDLPGPGSPAWSGLDTALAYVRNPSPEALSVALGQPTAPVTVPGAVSASTTYLAIAGVTAAPAAVLDQYSAVVGVTFAELWERLLGQQRHVEETTLDLYPTVHQALTAQRHASTARPPAPRRLRWRRSMRSCPCRR